MAGSRSGSPEYTRWGLIRASGSEFSSASDSKAIFIILFKLLIVFGGNRFIICFIIPHIISIVEKLREFGGHLWINLLFIAIHSSHVGINLSLNKNWSIFLDNLKL